MPIEMLPGFTANISMETQIQQNRRYTTIQLDIIHTGDCLEILKTLPDDSVHCCVVSAVLSSLSYPSGTGLFSGAISSPLTVVSLLVPVFLIFVMI